MSWLKMLHVFSVFLWVGGLLVGSRMVAVHVRETVDVQRRFAWLEGRLLLGATIPGMVVAWVLGLAMLARRPELLDAATMGPWFHVKLALVLVLTGLTIGLWRGTARVRRDPGTHHAPGPFMALHGIAGLLLLGVLWSLYVLGGH